MTHTNKKVVVIGGGTGTYTVLSGLKRYRELSLTAVVTMADSGGSTGRLRDEFGYLPVGDVRMALVALADDSITDNEHLRRLFLHRFEKGGVNLEGHNFGNLFLVALTDILGSEVEAIRCAARMLHARGEVLPVSTNDLTLVATYDDGMVVHGETDIDEPAPDRNLHRITALSVEPAGQVSPEAAAAIVNADMIILGPGDLYTSVLAVCVVPGVAHAIQQTQGTLVYVSNLMSKFGQTSGMSTDDCVREVERYVGSSVDHIITNTTALPEELLARYAEAGEYPLPVSTDVRSRGHDVLATTEVVKSKADRLRRSLIRHDADKLARAILAL